MGRFPITRSVRPVLFEIGGVDQVDLYIFGPPENVRLDPNDPVGELRPTFLWESPNTGGIPDAANDVISYQVRILPEELAFTDIGNTTSFTPTTDLTFGIHTFQVRAVGTGDRPDAVATLDVDIGIGVDDIPPDAPALVSPPDGAFVNDDTPVFDWDPSTGDRSTVGEEDVFEYVLRVARSANDIATGPFELEAVVPGDTTEFQATDSLADDVYRWRVLARDAAGNTGSSVTFTFTVDTVAPDGPGLSAPADQAFLNADPELFRWNRVSGQGVVDYLIQVTSGDISTGPYVIDEVVVHPVRRFDTPPGLNLKDTRYRWRVQARDAADNIGVSGTRTFTIDTIAPTDPTGLVDVTATADANVRVFNWTPSEDPVPATGTTGDESGVDFYRVVIPGEVAGDTVDHATCDANVCQYESPILAPGQHEIQVSAVDRATNESGVVTVGFRSGPRDVVQNLTVLDDDVVENVVATDNPRFQWSPPEVFPEGLTTYEVAITGDPVLAPDFAVPFTDYTDTAFFVAECFNQAGAPLGSGDACNAIQSGDQIRIVVITGDGVPDGTHEIGVRVVDGQGARKQPVRISFTVDTTPPAAPQLVAPKLNEFLNEAANIVLFDWDPSSGDVLTYLLRAVVSGDDIDTGPFEVDEVLIGDTEFRLATADRLGDDIYLWQVTARDEVLNAASSEVRTFTVDTIAPEPPAALVFPGDGEFINVNTPVLDWDPSPSPTGDRGAFVYDVQVALSTADLSIGSFVFTRVVPGTITKFAVSGDLTLVDDDYAWRVITRDRARNTGSSAAQTFSVDTIRPEAPAALVFPVDGELISVNTPVLEWDPSPSPTGDRGAFEYDVRVVFVTGDLVNGPFVVRQVVSGDTTEFLVTGDLTLPDDVYTWRVITRDRALNTAGTTAAVFTADTQAPVVSGLVKRGDDLDDTPGFDWETADNLSGTILHVVHIEGTSDRFVDVTVPDPPVLVDPADRLFTGEVASFAWRANDDISTSDAMTYVLEIAAGDATGDLGEFLIVARRDLVTGDGNAVFTGDGVLFTLAQALTADDSTGDFFWHVQAIDRAGNIGDFSQTFEFTLGEDNLPPESPVLVGPGTSDLPSNTTPTLDDVTPTFEWSSALDIGGPNTSDVASYGLEIAFGTADFTGLAFTADGIESTTFTPFVDDAPSTGGTLATTDGLATGDYIWHVRAVDRAGNVGDFGTSFIFTVVEDATGPEAPTLVSPESGDTLHTTTPTFEWTRPVDRGTKRGVVSSFILQIDVAGGNFLPPLRDVPGITDTADTLEDEDALPSGDYIWRVAAVDNRGNTGDFSDPSTFTVQPDNAGPSIPVPVSPTGDDVVGRITTFTWSQSQDALSGTASYTLQIADTGDFTTGLITHDDIPDDPVTNDLIQFTLGSGDELDTGDYFWRVRAVDQLGNTGGFSSPIGPFTVTGDTGDDRFPPPIPTLLSPSSGDATGDITPTFSRLRIKGVSGKRRCKWLPITDDIRLNRASVSR